MVSFLTGLMSHVVPAGAAGAAIKLASQPGDALGAASEALAEVDTWGRNNHRAASNVSSGCLALGPNTQTDRRLLESVAAYYLQKPKGYLAPTEVETGSNDPVMRRMLASKITFYYIFNKLVSKNVLLMPMPWRDKGVQLFEFELASYNGKMGKTCLKQFVDALRDKNINIKINQKIIEINEKTIRFNFLSLNVSDGMMEQMDYGSAISYSEVFSEQFLNSPAHLGSTIYHIVYRLCDDKQNLEKLWKLFDGMYMQHACHVDREPDLYRFCVKDVNYCIEKYSKIYAAIMEWKNKINIFQTKTAVNKKNVTQQFAQFKEPQEIKTITEVVVQFARFKKPQEIKTITEVVVLYLAINQFVAENLQVFGQFVFRRLKSFEHTEAVMDEIILFKVCEL